VVASIDLGLAQLPDITMHNTDRNRTSPFAFTGNKFEFRAVGSSQSVSIPVAFLNAAVAESLNELNAELAKMGKATIKQILGLLRPIIKRSRPIRFEHNNYSEEWAREAAERGLPNHKTTPAAYGIWEDAETRRFVMDSGVLREQEMEAHYHVRLEHYANSIHIEADLMVSLINNHVLPASFRYQKEMADSIGALKAVGLGQDIGAQEGQLLELSRHINALLGSRQQLEVAIAKAEDKTARERAETYATLVMPLMAEARGHADTLERLVPSSLWTLPSYHELLFIM